MKDKLAELVAAQISADEALKNLTAAISRFNDASEHVSKVSKEFGEMLKRLDIPYIDALEAEDNG